jgi:hypothetical protein
VFSGEAFDSLRSLAVSLSNRSGACFVQHPQVLILFRDVPFGYRNAAEDEVGDRLTLPDLALLTVLFAVLEHLIELGLAEHLARQV